MEAKCHPLAMCNGNISKLSLAGSLCVVLPFPFGHDHSHASVLCHSLRATRHPHTQFQRKSHTARRETIWPSEHRDALRLYSAIVKMKIQIN